MPKRQRYGVCAVTVDVHAGSLLIRVTSTLFDPRTGAGPPNRTVATAEPDTALHEVEHFLRQLEHLWAQRNPHGPSPKNE